MQPAGPVGPQCQQSCVAGPPTTRQMGPPVSVMAFKRPDAIRTWTREAAGSVSWVCLLGSKQRCFYKAESQRKV